MHVGELTQEILSQINANAEVEKRFIPKTDVWESAVGYHIHIYLPGMASEEIGLEYKDEFIIVSGERKNRMLSDISTEMKLNESDYGYFQRRIKLNEKVDQNKIKAKLEHGVLMISIQKLQAEGYRTQTKVA
jgi:HSP20 family protein